jgi:hypothetical protein
MDAHGQREDECSRGLRYRRRYTRGRGYASIYVHLRMQAYIAICVSEEVVRAFQAALDGPE